MSSQALESPVLPGLPRAPSLADDGLDHAALHTHPGDLVSGWVGHLSQERSALKRTRSSGCSVWPTPPSPNRRSCWTALSSSSRTAQRPTRLRRASRTCGASSTAPSLSTSVALQSQDDLILAAHVQGLPVDEFEYGGLAGKTGFELRNPVDRDVRGSLGPHTPAQIADANR